jgi:hypothetical protein
MKKLVLFASILAPGLVSAQTTINLATGLDGAGNLQTAGGLVDANWTTSGGVNPLAPPLAFTTAPGFGNSAFGAWIDNGPNSTWICVNPNDATGNGVFTATRTFNLTAAEAATATFQNLAWSIDDFGHLELNGHDISDLPGGLWGQMNPVTVSNNYFVAGTNTLSMVMDGSDNFLEAERLEGTVFATPEPSAFAGLGLGMLGLLAVRRRK